MDEAKRLLGKIRACIEIDSKLQDKYEDCISFLLLVLTHVCEIEFEDLNDISLCKKIVTFNSRFYPNPDKYVVANPEDRATAESLLESALLQSLWVRRILKDLSCIHIVIPMMFLNLLRNSNVLDFLKV